MKFEIFGESRSESVGVKIFGLEGAKIDTKAVQEFCNLRRPGFDELSTKRRENDEIIFCSGIDENGRHLIFQINSATVLQQFIVRFDSHVILHSEGILASEESVK